MDKYFIFKANGPIDRNYFESAFAGLGVKSSDITYSDAYNWEIVMDSEKYPEVDAILNSLRDDLGLSISVLASHQHTDFEDKLLRSAAGYLPNQVLFPTDVIMKEINFGNFSSLQYLKAMFKSVPHELMLTSGAYLRCGLNACLASRSLIIHRNTFNYRLDQFIKMTGLDIRDYHNALLLELYFQLSGGGSINR